MMYAMPTALLPSGEKVPQLGQGTWCMGEHRKHFREEVQAIRYGLDLGLTLIDTAEMYGEGGAEEVVGEAVHGRRDETFIVSKVYPHHASQKGVIQACERSLKRLKTDRIDLYLLHWRGNIPLSETVAGFEALAADGKIRYWGVSNFDTDDMKELFKIGQGNRVQANQVLYNLENREMEWSLYPWCQAYQVSIMAYCPLGQGMLSKDKTLNRIAQTHRATPAQVALAWLLTKKDVMVIPKAARQEHILENTKALDIRLTEEDLSLLDSAFPAPKQSVALETV